MKLYIANIKLVLVGRPKPRARQKTKPKEERIIILHENIPVVLNDDNKIPESHYSATIHRLTRERVKDHNLYHITYFLDNVRFSSKIMVDLQA
jgi:hypothetical protein